MPFITFKNENALYHAEKGSTWSNHKYIRIENGRYIYPEDLEGNKGTSNKTSGNAKANIQADQNTKLTNVINYNTKASKEARKNRIVDATFALEEMNSAINDYENLASPKEKAKQLPKVTEKCAYAIQKAYDGMEYSLNNIAEQVNSMLSSPAYSRNKEFYDKKIQEIINNSKATINALLKSYDYAKKQADKIDKNWTAKSKNEMKLNAMEDSIGAIKDYNKWNASDFIDYMKKNR